MSRANVVTDLHKRQERNCATLQTDADGAGIGVASKLEARRRHIGNNAIAACNHGRPRDAHFEAFLCSFGFRQDDTLFIKGLPKFADGCELYQFARLPINGAIAGF